MIFFRKSHEQMINIKSIPINKIKLPYIYKYDKFPYVVSLYIIFNKFDFQGTTSIEGILLNMSEMTRDVKMNPAAFSKMCNLRFLKIYRDNNDSKKFKLYLPRGLESFVSNELRYFQWDFYPLESLPSDFAPENLVELILRHSYLGQLKNHVVKVCVF